MSLVMYMYSKGKESTLVVSYWWIMHNIVVAIVSEILVAK